MAHVIGEIATNSGTQYGQSTSGNLVVEGSGNAVGALAKQPIQINTIYDIVCFTPGVLITTKDGEVPVETLKAGDLVLTADNGFQPIIWSGFKSLSGARLHACEHLRPIKISAGALGDDLPSKDMWVSPQHRMLTKDPIARALYGHDETLAPAKGLENGDTIIVDRDVVRVKYIHLLFEDHQIIFANGAPSESFHPDRSSIDALTDASRREVLDLFPQLSKDPDHLGPFARTILTLEQGKHVTQEKTGIFCQIRCSHIFGNHREYSSATSPRYPLHANQYAT